MFVKSNPGSHWTSWCYRFPGTPRPAGNAWRKRNRWYPRSQGRQSESSFPDLSKNSCHEKLKIFVVVLQGDLGEKGPEGASGKDGSRVSHSESIVLSLHRKPKDLFSNHRLSLRV